MHALRSLLLATCLLALVSAGESVPVLAAPRSQLQVAVYSMQVTPEDKVTLCPGQKQEFDAVLSKQVLLPPSRWNLNPASAWSTEALEGQIIESNVLNRQVGSIALISTATRQIGGQLYAYVPFVFKARNVGTTDITFSDQGPDGSVGAGRPRVSNETRTVEVKPCKYHLVAFSSWILNDGFIPHAMLTLDAEFTPDRVGDFNVMGTMENAAHHLRQFNCTHIINVPTTQAQVSGHLDIDTGEMRININYPSVAATTKIECPTPFGPVGSGVQDPGKPLVLTTRPLNITAQAGTITAGNLAHLLHVYLGDVTGNASVIVVPVPQ